MAVAESVQEFRTVNLKPRFCILLWSFYGKGKKSNLIIFSVLGIFFVFILVTFLIHIFETNRFNAKERFVSDNESAECIISLYPRAGLADSWDKRDIEFNDEIVTFTGTTYDCMVQNFSDSVITDWNIRINIKKECYINNS
ncbi:MAG: hypothetical protein IJR39_07475 [Treponema sp.]|nr:hypothetical protein [Treponema sp.]